VGEVVIVANQPHYSGLALFPPGAEVQLGIEATQARLLAG
jgi:iron(III) transport system ATP-binding protein